MHHVSVERLRRREKVSPCRRSTTAWFTQPYFSRTAPAICRNR